MNNFLWGLLKRDIITMGWVIIILFMTFIYSLIIFISKWCTYEQSTENSTITVPLALHPLNTLKTRWEKDFEEILDEQQWNEIWKDAFFRTWENNFKVVKQWNMHAAKLYRISQSSSPLCWWDWKLPRLLWFFPGFL